MHAGYGTWHLRCVLNDLMHHTTLACHSPRTFEIESTKYGRARVISQAADTPEDIEIAMEVRPVCCHAASHLLTSQPASQGGYAVLHAGVPCELHLL
jgi:hypothetical protein